MRKIVAFATAAMSAGFLALAVGTAVAGTVPAAKPIPTPPSPTSAPRCTVVYEQTDVMQVRTCPPDGAVHVYAWQGGTWVQVWPTV